MTVISDLIDRYQQTTDRDLAESVLPFEAKRRPESNPHNHKPIFLTALDFDRRYRAALETDSIADFRQRLIDCGGLVIDDIHKLADKSAAQNEFVLILEAMCRKNRPLVVTLDTPPQICLGLSPQLISRLSGGLSIPVNPPGPLARLEIIRDLAEINDVHLTDDAAQLLVDRLKVTVPKLDHVFAQIKTKLRIRSEDPLQPIDAAKLMLIFKKSNSDQEKLSQLIIKLAAAEFDLKVSELKSNSRKQSIVMARGVSIYLIRVLLGTSFLKIGSYLGGRDHSTIMHAFRKLENLVTNNDHFADDNSVKNSVTKLKQRLTEQFASQINFF
jgi:chromosomal replication initiator protein